MLIRNNKNAPVGLFVASAKPGHQQFKIGPGDMVAMADELDDEIRTHRGNSILFACGELEEITPEHVRVSVPEDGRRPRVRLEAPVADSALAEDWTSRSPRAVVIEAGDIVLVHPDFLAADGVARLIESGELEVAA